MIYETLCKIAKGLDQQNVCWAVGASLLLHQYNLDENPRDIDILVAVEDHSKFEAALASMGFYQQKTESKRYATQYFDEFIVDGIEVDGMAGLALLHDNGIYRHKFDRSSVREFRYINGYSIPFSTLEEWYILYQLIPGRENKVEKLEHFLLTDGIRHENLLLSMLDGCLPEMVVVRTKKLLR